MAANNLYGLSMVEPLPYDESEMWHGHPDLYRNKIEEILNTPDDTDNGFSVEVDLESPDNINEETKDFPFAPEKKVIPKDKYNDYMKKIKLKDHAKSKKYNVIGLIRKIL